MDKTRIVIAALATVLTFSFGLPLVAQDPVEPDAASTALPFVLKMGDVATYRITLDKTLATPPVSDDKEGHEKSISKTYTIQCTKSFADGGGVLSVQIAPASPVAGSERAANPAAFDVTVDSRGRVLQCERVGLAAARSDEGGSVERPVSAGETLSLAQDHQLRTNLALIFGSGLHGRQLESGSDYPLDLGTMMLASPDRLASQHQKDWTMPRLAFQFTGTSAPEGEKLGLARFSLVPADSSSDPTHKPDVAKIQVSGNASYHLEKGCLQELTALVRCAAPKAPGSEDEVVEEKFDSVSLNIRSVEATQKGDDDK